MTEQSRDRTLEDIIFGQRPCQITPEAGKAFIMDTTGVVLGAVGLLAIADKFDALHTLFTTFHQYRNEVSTFTTFLKVKRTAFRTECRLLSSQLERNSGSQQPGLYQGQVVTLADLLGPSYDSCESILTEIEQSLEKISREAEGFANLPIEVY